MIFIGFLGPCMAKLGLLSTDRTIRSGLQTILVILMLLGISGSIFVTELFFRRYLSYTSYIFIGLGIVIALSGFFGLITKQFADGLSAGLGLHEQVKTGIQTKPKSMTIEQTLEAGFNVMRVIVGIVFLSILSFSVGSFLDSVSEPKTTFTCDDGELISISQVEDGIFDCSNGGDELVGTFQDAAGSNQTLKILSVTIKVFSMIIIVAGCLGLFTKGIADTVSIGLSLHDDRLTVSDIGEKAQKHSEKADETNPSKLMRACPQCSVSMKFPNSVGIKIRCPNCKLELIHHGQGWLVSLTSAEE